MTSFSKRVLNWFQQHGRHDLPWQKNPTPYRVWVSEIMLQQTQVSTVIPYYQRFMKSFPSVKALANAEQDLVLHHWTGLGYYARARNLHASAKVIVSDHGGRLPRSLEDLMNLAGIGQSTAGAIAAISMDLRASILDGNVKRVLCRHRAIAGWPEQTQVKQQLWEMAEQLTPHNDIADYTQAMMDLGATLCTRSKPNCPQCPLQADCKALATDSIALYPGKKPKKKLPIKAVSMHMLENTQRQVLLEKRPPTGIWGGLWSFPESTKPSEPPMTMHQALRSQPSQSWKTLRHTFSHYHLDITPVHVKIKDNSSAVMDSSRWLWYPLDNSVEVGLAAPVRKLLNQLAQMKK